MRQIDNMTPQELDTLALKGMTAPRTASERPAPNKAQHSPEIDAKRPWQNETITWKSGGVTDEERIANLQFSLRNEVNAHVKVIKQRDNLKAHADKLAEALRGIKAVLNQPVQFSDGKGGSFSIIQGDCAVARKFTEAALAAYEKESK